MALKQEDRWEARPKTAAALKLAIYALPFVASALVANQTQRTLVHGSLELPWLAAACTSLPVAVLTLVATGRLTRRLLPLAFLLKLSLLFPDQVPGRLGLALRAASTKRVLRRLHETDGDSRLAEDLLGLVAALGAHDRRTRGHSERVRAVTMLLADEMGIGGEDRDKLEWAALLHDLGKLDVPPEILNKSGRPTDEEWAILRTHPAGGPVHAASLSEWLGEWIHAMDQHHERFDGTGYPLGLIAEQISLSGRIVAVSDAFEVMTATRSYKSPMTTQAAREELVRCARTHFDPAAVRAFMAVSIGDLHRALGPTSWLASIPFVGSATTGVGTAASGLLLGGTVTPALAAAAAIMMVPVADPPLSAPSAIASVSEVVDGSDSNVDPSDAAADSARGELVGAESSADDVAAPPGQNGNDGIVPLDPLDLDPPGVGLPGDAPPVDPAFYELDDRTDGRESTVPGDGLIGDVDVGDLVDEVVNEALNEVVTPVLDEVVDPVIDDLVEPVVNEVVTPVLDEVVDPVVDEVVDPVFDHLVEPVLDDLIEPAVDETIGDGGLIEHVLDPLPEPPGVDGLLFS